MSGAPPLRRFALDHNFPTPLVDAIVPFLPPYVELVPIRRIDAAWVDLDDWRLIVALAQHSEHWDGLVTNDGNMLRLPREVSALLQSKLSLVVMDRAGNNAISACGILLMILKSICHQTDPTKPQVFRRGMGSPPKAADPWDSMRAIAKVTGTTASEVYAAHKLTDAQLSGTEPLPDDDE